MVTEEVFLKGYVAAEILAVKSRKQFGWRTRKAICAQRAVGDRGAGRMELVVRCRRWGRFADGFREHEIINIRRQFRPNARFNNETPSHFHRPREVAPKLSELVLKTRKLTLHLPHPSADVEIAIPSRRAFSILSTSRRQGLAPWFSNRPFHESPRLALALCGTPRCSRICCASSATWRAAPR